MKATRVILFATLLATMLMVAGCKKKKPPVPPPQANAPAVTEPAPQPAAPPAEETKPETKVEPPPPTPEATAEKPKPKPRLRPRIHAARKEPPKEPSKEAPKEPARSTRTVVPEGSTPPGGQLSAAIPDQAASNQKFNTEQLLQATDYNLKSIKRTLTGDEQTMVQHIHSYMQQSREATAQGDTQRAYNLALKAHLLSDEIAKR